MIEDLCEIPVVGVVPFMNLDIEDEDKAKQRPGARRKLADWWISPWSVCLGFQTLRISQVFSCIPEVSLRYVQRQRTGQTGSGDHSGNEKHHRGSLCGCEALDWKQR